MLLCRMTVRYENLRSLLQFYDLNLKLCGVDLGAVNHPHVHVHD